MMCIYGIKSHLFELLVRPIFSFCRVLSFPPCISLSFSLFASDLMWRSLPDPPSHISWFGRLWVLLKSLKKGKFIASDFFSDDFSIEREDETRRRERINSIHVRSWWKVRRVELVQRREVSYRVTSNDDREGDSTGRRFIPGNHSRTSSHFLSSVEPISCFPSSDTFLLRSFLPKGEIVFPLHFLPSFPRFRRESWKTV